MIHPDTLSAMAKYKRGQIEYQQDQIRLAKGPAVAPQAGTNLAGRVAGFLRDLASHSRRPAAEVTGRRNPDSAI